MLRSTLLAAATLALGLSSLSAQEFGYAASRQTAVPTQGYCEDAFAAEDYARAAGLCAQPARTNALPSFTTGVDQVFRFGGDSATPWHRAVPQERIAAFTIIRPRLRADALGLASDSE